MKCLSRLLAIILLACLMSGGQCQSPAIVVPQGPVATQLSAEKDKQIAGLVAQVKAEQEARLLEQAQASLVAANLEGILFAAEHVPTGLPRNAIEEEAKLGKERSPPANPAELLKAKDRVIAILNGEVEKAKALYGAAFDEAKQAKAQIAAKDREIAERDAKIRDGEIAIAKLTKDAKTEQATNQKKLTSTIEDYEKRLNDKDQEWFLRIWGLVSIGLGIAGIALIALSQGAKLIEGGILIVGAGLSILGRLWYVTLLNAWWFPYAAGLVAAIVVAALFYAGYRLWKSLGLHRRITAALQDQRDESITKGTGDFAKTEEHLKYRLGDKNSFWGKAQLDEVARLGLVDTKGEEALKGP